MDYHIKRLDQVCTEFQNGIGKNKEFYGKGTKVANIGDLYQAPTFEPVKYSLLDVSDKEIQKYALQRGDILFVRSSVKKEGVAYASMYNSDELCLFSSFMIKATPNQNLIFPKFLAYQLRSSKLRQLLVNASNTSTITNISQPNLKKIEVVVPPLAQQKRIANILDHADTLRKTQKQKIQQFDQLLKSTFFEMFGDPLRNLKKWKPIKAEKLYNIQLGKMLSAKNYTGTHLRPYLRNVNVKWHHLNLSDIKMMDFNEKDFQKYALKSGDILVCEGGEVGRTAIYNGEIENCCYQNALHRLRPKQQGVINSYYFMFYMWFSAECGLIERLTSTVTIAHFTAKKFKQFEILVPPLALQEKFAEIVSKIEAQKVVSQQSLKKYEDLFQCLLQKAFKGEL